MLNVIFSAATLHQRPYDSFGRPPPADCLVRRFFRVNALRRLLNSRFLLTFLLWFLRLVGMRHSHRPSISPFSILLLTNIWPTSDSLLAACTTSSAAVSQLCYRRHGCHRKRFCAVKMHHHRLMLLARLHYHREVAVSLGVLWDTDRCENSKDSSYGDCDEARKHGWRGLWVLIQGRQEWCALCA